jgi:hypothetical protein
MLTKLRAMPVLLVVVFANASITATAASLPHHCADYSLQLLPHAVCTHTRTKNRTTAARTQ